MGEGRWGGLHLKGVLVRARSDIRGRRLHNRVLSFHLLLFYNFVQGLRIPLVMHCTHLSKAGCPEVTQALYLQPAGGVVIL